MTPLKDIVAARLRELGRNPFEAAEKGGLERSFINELLIGKKQSVLGRNLEKLAAALDWTAAQLISRQNGAIEEAVNEGERQASPSRISLEMAAEVFGFDPERLRKGIQMTYEIDALDAHLRSQGYDEKVRRELIRQLAKSLAPVRGA